MGTYNDIQLIKREFFAMRNGIIADNMRRAGMPYKIIFGLNLPQLQEIAGAVGENREMAERLWENRTTRESMLLAPMIFPRAEMTRELARKWVGESMSVEVADMLCHKLLRHLPFALEFAEELSASDAMMDRYASLRLLFNLLPSSKEIARKIAAAEISKAEQPVLSLARRLLDEVEFLDEEA